MCGGILAKCNMQNIFDLGASNLSFDIIHNKYGFIWKKYSQGKEKKLFFLNKQDEREG